MKTDLSSNNSNAIDGLEEPPTSTPPPCRAACGPNPPPPANGNGASVFPFDYLPAGVSKGPLSKEYCNNTFPVGSLAGIWTNSNIEFSKRPKYFVKMSADKQLFAATESGEEWPMSGENEGSFTRTGDSSAPSIVAGDDQLCFAQGVISRGFHPNQLKLNSGSDKR